MGKKTPDDLVAEKRVRGHVRALMDDLGISRAELARRLKSDDGNTSRILGGGRGIGLGLVVRICDELGITPTRLLTEDPDDRYTDEATDFATTLEDIRAAVQKKKGTK